jgi:hypothetical protein
MTTPETSLAEQPAANDSSPDNEISSYTEIFCRAMTRLNAVSLEQIEGLLNIAVKAAEKVHSINASAAAPTDEKLTEFVNQIKNTADRMSQTNQPPAENASTPAAINPEAFPALVEQTLGNAIHNSANNQQELNIIGAAILTQAASLLLSSGASKPAGGEQ